jgi:hypothetical protein
MIELVKTLNGTNRRTVISEPLIIPAQTFPGDEFDVKICVRFIRPLVGKQKSEPWWINRSMLTPQIR